MDDSDNTDSGLIPGKTELQMYDWNILPLLQTLANEDTNSSLCKWKSMLLQKHKQGVSVLQLQCHDVTKAIEPKWPKA